MIKKLEELVSESSELLDGQGIEVILANCGYYICIKN